MEENTLFPAILHKINNKKIMDIIKKKEEIQTKFNQAIQQREQLSALIEQLRGQFALLDEIEKEDKTKELKEDK